MGTNWWISVTRTIVAPFLVGFLFQWLVASDVGFVWRSTSFAAAAFIYYCAARALQEWNPYLGFMLIVAARPHYRVHDNYWTEDEIDPFIVSMVRTVVPLVAGSALAIFARLILGLDGTAAVLLQVLLTAVFYGGLRWLEERPRTREVAGWMLGSPLALHY